MKTITKDYTIYTFPELDQKAKDKARERFNEDGSNLYFLSDNMNERLYELLEENKITDTNDTSKPGTKPTQVFYSLSYSQGDGAMFEGNYIWNNLYVYIKQKGHYYHSNSKTITIYKRVWNELDGIEIEEEIDSVECGFEAIYQKICKELEQYGYNEIEYQNSEEVFAENCEANGYTFLSDGTMFNE
jgi:hypothetical protein